MAKSRNTFSAIFIRFILPGLAILSAGVAIYAWYTALHPTVTPPPAVAPRRAQVKPDAFTAGLQGNLENTLGDVGISPETIMRKDADPDASGVRTIYTIPVPVDMSLTLLNLRVTGMVYDMGGTVFRGIEGSDGTRLMLTVGARQTPTDLVVFKKTQKVTVARARLAIIVDDLGVKDTVLAKRLCDLEQVVTLAIMPHRPHTKDVIRMATESGTPYILHMPMEPKSSSANPGDGAIHVTDSDDGIRKKLSRAFDSVEGSPGMNNHMGSLVTEDLRVMEIIADFLARRRLFFVDSRTSLDTRGYETTQKHGVKSRLIDGYIDATEERAVIEDKLARLVDIARTRGSAVAICHDRPLTVEILERELPRIEKSGIDFVPVEDLVR